MLTRKALFMFTAVLLAFCVSASFAQYTVVMEETDVPLHVAQKVASQNGASISDAKAMASIAPSAYLKASGKANTSTIHLASNGHYAVESHDRSEKTTVVWNGKMNIIMWNQKKVMQMTPEQIEQLVKGAHEMLGQMQQNMPDLEKMLQNSNIPKEQLEAAKKAMAGMPKAQGGKTAKPNVSKTSKNATIANQFASLYIVEEGAKTRGIWASSSNKTLANKFKEMGEQMAALSEMAKQYEGTPEWELLPGMYPVASVDISDGMFGQKNMRARSTKSITKGEPSKKAFYIPGPAEGFKVGGMEVMMEGFPNMKQ